jgi:hypothetical protein
MGVITPSLEGFDEGARSPANIPTGEVISWESPIRQIL